MNDFKMPLDRRQSLRDDLKGLQRRWNDRLTRKDFESLPEAYLSGRIAVAVDFDVVGCPPLEGIPGESVAKTRRYCLVFEGHTWDFESHVLERHFADDRHDRAMLIVAVDAIDGPKKLIPSFIGLYLIDDKVGESAVTLPYYCVPAFLRGSGSVHGHCERFPIPPKWESRARRLAAIGSHDTKNDMIEGTTQVIECVSDQEPEVGRKILGWLKDNVQGVVVHLRGKSAEVVFDEKLDQIIQMRHVAVGPIDL